MLVQQARYIDNTFHLVSGAIRIENDRIVRIEASLSPLPDEEVFQADGLLIIPALADCHIHTPDTLLRGLFQDMALADWCDDSVQGRLQKKAFAYLDNAVGSEDFHTLVLHSYLQYVRQGIGFVVENGQADHSFTILQQGMERIGLKGVVDLYTDVYSGLSQTATIIHGTHVPEEEDLNPESLREAIRARTAILSSGENHPIMTHCLETDSRRQEIMHKYGVSTVELLRQNGLLGPGTLLFHCVQVDASDIATIGAFGALVVHCPVSNSWSGAGRMPLVAMLEQGIPIVLGTDFLHHDLWETMRATYYELKQQGMTGYGINEVFTMATANAGLIAGGGLYQGVIRAGAPADIAFLKLEDCLQPLVECPGFSNVVHNLISQTQPDMIRHLMVAGKWVMRDRKVLTVDETTVETEYRRIREMLFTD